MNKTLMLSFLLFLSVTGLALAHAGEVHNYMGTVGTMHKDGSFVLQKTDGEAFHVHVNKATRYLKADGSPARAADLRPGLRVVAKIGKDGRTAISIKLARK